MTSLVRATRIAIAGRLGPVDLALDGGGLTAVIGPNGSGKTSLLRALARIAGSGRVTVDGEDLERSAPARRRVLAAFLPASRDMVWPIRVAAVIALGLQRPDPGRVAELIDMLELAPLAHRPINGLSTGERARVLLARALASRPRLLLLDEPLSNLDPYWALRIVALLGEVARAESCVTLFSVHDLDLALHAQRVLLLDRGELEADGSAAAVIASDALKSAFGVERGGSGWAISASADRRSLP